MKHSTLLKVVFNTMSLLHTTIPLACPVSATTAGTPTNESHRLDEIFLAMSTSISESFGITDELQSLITSINPKDYKNNVEYVTKVFKIRPRAPMYKGYKIAEYKGLSKLLSLVLCFIMGVTISFCISNKGVSFKICDQY